jgi:hypothetical protein
VPRVTDEAVATAERLLAGVVDQAPSAATPDAIDSLAPVGYTWRGLFVLRCEVA